MAHSHEHHHDHHGHHHGHASKLTSLNGIFVFSIVLNLLYVIIEALVGFWQNSLSLLSDAGHNLSDVFSLLLVLIAFQLAKVHANKVIRSQPYLSPSSMRSCCSWLSAASSSRAIISSMSRLRSTEQSYRGRLVWVSSSMA